ncbi:MAG: hypothetical protein ACOX43_00785 [Bacilli bacterium]|jgi:hypothetical protein
MSKNDLNIEINDVVVLANNESVLETFTGFEIIEPIGKGYFTITNRRLIYYATFRDKLSNSIAVRECSLEDVGVISSEYGKRTNKLQKTIGFIIFLLGLALVLYGVSNFVIKKVPYGLEALIAGGVFFLAGLIVVVTSKRKMFSLEVFTNTSQSNFVSLTSDYFQSPSRGRIKIKPNRETGSMIKALGKYVLEAKARKY